MAPARKGDASGTIGMISTLEAWTLIAAGRRGLRNGAELQRVFAFAAGQFESVLRQCGLEVFHFTGIGEVDLCLVRVRLDDVHPGYRFGGAQPRAERRPILNRIELDVDGEMRGAVIDRRDRAIDGLFPLTRCVDHCPGEDNVRPAQQLTHRFRIEMKRDVGEVARRVAPFIAGVTAEDQAEKLALGELRLCSPDRLTGEAAEERAPSERPSLHHGEVARSPWGFSCRVDLDANDGELIGDFDRGRRRRGPVKRRT